MIEYPYMPEGRELKHVPHDSTFMQAAKLAMEECAGDSNWPVGIVAVKDGEVVARAGNGFNRGPQGKHVCPRIVLGCKSGEGYDLCDVHDPAGHSELQLVKAMQEAGIDTNSADAYMYGHWWACEPCWTTLIGAGFRDLYVTDDAHERFTKEKVYGRTLQTTLKSAYIAGAITGVFGEDGWEKRSGLYESVGEVCKEMGIKACIPHRDNGESEVGKEKDAKKVYEWSTQKACDNDVVIAEVSLPSTGTGGELVEAVHCAVPIVLLSEKGAHVSQFVIGNPNVRYHVEYESVEEACRKLRNVLRQL